QGWNGFFPSQQLGRPSARHLSRIDARLARRCCYKGVVVTYDGWYAPIYFVEEDKDPAKNLPRSMIGTALSCIAIFLLVNAALFHVLHMDHLAGCSSFLFPRLQ